MQPTNTETKTRGRKAVALTSTGNTMNIGPKGAKEKISFNLEALPSQLSREDLEKLAEQALKLKIRQVLTAKILGLQQSIKTAEFMLKGMEAAGKKSGLKGKSLEDFLQAAKDNLTEQGFIFAKPEVWNITLDDLSVEVEEEEE